MTEISSSGGLSPQEKRDAAQSKIDTPRPRKTGTSIPGAIARLGALFGLTVGAGAAVEKTVHPIENTASAVVRGIEDIKNTGEQVVDVNSGAYGKFLTRQEDGTLVASDTPQIVEVKYTPHADPTSKHWNENNIVVHRKPQADFGEGQDVPVDEIKATHAIRVTGGAFGGQTDIGRFEVEINGVKYTVGEWFQPSDEQGNPVNLQGQTLNEGEKPWYVAGSFATVQNSSVTSQTPTQ